MMLGAAVLLASWAAARDDFKEIDQALAAAAAVPPAVEGCLARQSQFSEDIRKSGGAPPVPAFCRSGFPVDRMQTDPTVLASVPINIFHDFHLEYAMECSAAAKKDMGACDVLDAADAVMGRTGMTALKSDCRKMYVQGSVAKVLARDPASLKQFCEDLYARYPMMREAPIPKLCLQIATYPTDPEAVCDIAGKIVNKHIHLDERPRCLRTVRMLMGDADCAAYEDHDERHRCETFNLYRKARRDNDPASCGDSAVCRAFVDEDAGRCREVARKDRADYCAPFWARSSPPALAAAPRETPEAKDTVYARLKSLLDETARSCDRMVEGMQASVDKAQALLKAKSAARGADARPRLELARRLQDQAAALSQRTHH